MLSIRSQYLNELKIPEYLHAISSSAASATRSQKINIKCLVVEFDQSNSICSSGEVQDFLYKMLGAIGLQKQEVICISEAIENIEQALEKYNTQVVLLAGVSLPIQSKSVLNIHHPNKIIANEQLKREAWEVLKQAKLCLQ